MRPARTLMLRAFADARLRTLCFAAFFFLYGLVQPIGYAKAYPKLADRIGLAQSFGTNPALQLFYGAPHQLQTVGGYTAWRVGGFTALVAAFVGLLAAVRAFRGEEESGRFEIVAVGAISRRAAFASRLAAIGLMIAALWLALALGVLLGGLSAGGAAYLALAVLSVAAVYAAIGVVASQLMPSAGAALQLGGAVFALDFLVRILADVGGHPGLHWLIPLGWAEELRPFSDPRPAVLLLPIILTAALALGALAIERRRDLGAALFASRDTARPRLRLLRSPTLLALRSQALGLIVWLLATAFFAIILGTLAKTVISGLTADMRQQLAKLGTGELTTAQGVLGFFFLLFILEIAFFCCSQIGSARGEEANGRLETLFALPANRMRWLGGRLAIAALGALLIALAAGLGTAIGATAAGSSVSFAKLIEAGLNCLPACALFLGIGALLIALRPREGVGLAYGLVSVAFVWDLIGDLLGAPSWLLGLSPFHQVGFVPAVPFRAGPAAVMIAIGVAAAIVALIRFRERDLVGV
jgi:ABC-2 type transport system permease protein